MKKLMRLLLVVNLVIVNSLCASAGSAGTGAAQSTKSCTTGDVKQGSEQIELPRNVVLFLQNRIDRFNEPFVYDNCLSLDLSKGRFKKWLDENPKYLNAVEKESGSTLLMLAIDGLRGISDPWLYDSRQNIYDILSMNPNVLAENNQQENALEGIILALSQNSFFSDYSKDDMVSKIFDLMTKQGADFQKMLESARKKIFAWGRGFGYQNYIDLLEQEQDKQGKLELRKAREVLTPSATDTESILPKVLGTIFEPSNQHLIAIKHAIEDNNQGKLAKALENNKWLEIPDGTGYTPFLYAAYINKPDMMRYLIRQGADVNAQTKDGVGATYFGDYQELIDNERNAFRIENDPKLRALKELRLELDGILQTLGDVAQSDYYEDENKKQLQKQLDDVRPLLSDEQRKQLEQCASKFTDDYDSYADQLASLVSGWLKALRLEKYSKLTALEKLQIELDGILQTLSDVAQSEYYAEYDEDEDTYKYKKQLQEQLDDVRPLLSDEQREQLEEYASGLTHDYDSYAHRLDSLVSGWLEALKLNLAKQSK